MTKRATGQAWLLRTGRQLSVRNEAASTTAKEGGAEDRSSPDESVIVAHGTDLNENSAVARQTGGGQISRFGRICDGAQRLHGRSRRSFPTGKN